jgi:hypothetical protein
MSAQMDPFRFAAMIFDLERQMTELLALRRAICLLNAKGSRPLGARHPRRRRALARCKAQKVLRTVRYREFDQRGVTPSPST